MSFSDCLLCVFAGFCGCQPSTEELEGHRHLAAGDRGGLLSHHYVGCRPHTWYVKILYIIKSTRCWGLYWEILVQSMFPSCQLKHSEVIVILKNNFETFRAFWHGTSSCVGTSIGRFPPVAIRRQTLTLRFDVITHMIVVVSCFYWTDNSGEFLPQITHLKHFTLDLLFLPILMLFFNLSWQLDLSCNWVVKY